MHIKIYLLHTLNINKHICFIFYILRFFFKGLPQVLPSFMLLLLIFVCVFSLGAFFGVGHNPNSGNLKESDTLIYNVLIA